MSNTLIHIISMTVFWAAIAAVVAAVRAGNKPGRDQ